jgi:hypothetical protein
MSNIISHSKKKAIMYIVSSTKKICVILLFATQQIAYCAHSSPIWQVNQSTRERNAAAEHAFSHPDNMRQYRDYVQDKTFRQDRAEVLYQAEKAAKNNLNTATNKVAQLLVGRECNQVATELTEARKKMDVQMNVRAFTFDNMIHKAREEFQQRITDAHQKKQAVLANPSTKRSEHNRVSAYAEKVQREAPAKFIQSLRQQNSDWYHNILADHTKSKKDKNKAHAAWMRREQDIDLMIGLASDRDSNSHVHSNERASGHMRSAL